jgi:hypothetical protein
VFMETYCRHARITSLVSFGIEEYETWYQVHKSGIVFQDIYVSETEQMQLFFFISTIPGINPLTAHSKTQGWSDVSYREVLLSCS